MDIGYLCFVNWVIGFGNQTMITALVNYKKQICRRSYVHCFDLVSELSLHSFRSHHINTNWHKFSDASIHYFHRCAFDCAIFDGIFADDNCVFIHAKSQKRFKAKNAYLDRIFVRLARDQILYKNKTSHEPGQSVFVRIETKLQFHIMHLCSKHSRYDWRINVYNYCRMSICSCWVSGFQLVHSILFHSKYALFELIFTNTPLTKAIRNWNTWFLYVECSKIIPTPPLILSLKVFHFDSQDNHGNVCDAFINIIIWFTNLGN